MQRIAVLAAVVGQFAAGPEHGADRERGEQGAGVDGKQPSQDARHPSLSPASWRAGRVNAPVETGAFTRPARLAVDGAGWGEDADGAGHGSDTHPIDCVACESGPAYNSPW